MDLVGYSEEVFNRIRAEFSEYLHQLGLADVLFIPISALEGDNVAYRSSRMPWYTGASLLEHLETTPLADRESQGLRLPVQYVLRPDLNFRGYAGQIASGEIRVGDAVMVLPSGRTSRVKSLPSFDGDLERASAPMSVTVCLEDELDISRGDMLVRGDNLPHVSRSLQAKIVWMNEQPLQVNRHYLIKHTTQQVAAQISAVHCKIDVNTLAQVPASDLQLNEIGIVTVEANRPLYFDRYRDNRHTGSFILIDPLTNATVGAGIIEQREEQGPENKVRSALLQVEATRLTPAERYARAGHYPAAVWLTARNELAYVLERKLFDRACQVHVLADSAETSILPELAQLLTSAGLISIFSLPTFDWEERERARALVGSERFFAFTPEDLSSEDDGAAEQICAALESAGVIRSTRFAAGEGI